MFEKKRETAAHQNHRCRWSKNQVAVTKPKIDFSTLGAAMIASVLGVFIAPYSVNAEPQDLPTPYSHMEVLPDNTPAFSIVIEELGQQQEIAQNEYLCNSGFAFNPLLGSCAFSIDVNPTETQMANLEVFREDDILFGPSAFSGNESQSAYNADDLLLDFNNDQKPFVYQIPSLELSKLPTLPQKFEIDDSSVFSGTYELSPID